ncbi:unnamed protein product [Lactuca saligna]|uniref:ATP synthase epsilon subunit C-terminal domain-containing protein n=1 Tax=Lactuca saligna TaxID=75948 RepID=A0AA35YDX1_LACSI|nr:unnamed protein product [Lactuca saligna]
MDLMGSFARIGNNEITVLVNDAEKSGDIDPQEAQQTLEIAEAALRKAEGKRQKIEANLALQQARTRLSSWQILKDVTEQKKKAREGGDDALNEATKEGGDTNTLTVMAPIA